MINYHQLGGEKQLNEIVFAGSHDAGITGGKSNIQTQNLDIFGQASAGVRMFDLRVAAAKSGGTIGGQKVAELRTFHADGMLKKDETKTRYMHEFGRTETITRTKLKGGDFGMGLEQVLDDAYRFVRSGDGSSEFLLLKFDKCTNWELIAEACVGVLGGNVFFPTGNLNTKTLDELMSKVVVLFTASGMQAVNHSFRPGSGIHGIHNLASGGAYSNTYDGLQYHGKGGTNPFNAFKKTSQNEKKQAKLMNAGGHGNPNVMGMMYWTTTGLKESIYKRDEQMWNTPGKMKLLSLWHGGMGQAVQDGAPRNSLNGRGSSGAVIKAFMPNIIMIDFADDHKCQTIYDLNNVNNHELVGLDDFD